MDFICNNCDVIYAVLISGILGAIGQALRIGVRLFQLNFNKHPLVNAEDESHPSYKLGGIFVGFAMGILLTLGTNTIVQAFTLQRIVALIAAGYALTYGIEIAAIYLFKKQKSRHHYSNAKLAKTPLSYTPVLQSQFDS